MSEHYKSVLEMINAQSSDESFKNIVSKEIQEKQLAKFLFYLRCQKNLSQKQLAEKLNCTQSRISKIESAYDKDLSIRDLLDYAKVLDLRLEILYKPRTAKIVDEIKYHAFKIKKYLERLSSLAKDDDSLVEGIKKFYMDAFWNINKIISESFSKLPVRQFADPEKKPVVHVSSPLENPDMIKFGQK